MAHTFTSLLFHVVFSTKNRRNLITAEIQPRLWSYMGGIARDLGATAVQIGGVEDHVHMLLATPAQLAIADAIQRIKGSSSHWVHQQVKDFAWQDGYSAFSVGIAQRENTVRYIQQQAEHHQKHSFAEEAAPPLKRRATFPASLPRGVRRRFAVDNPDRVSGCAARSLGRSPDLPSVAPSGLALFGRADPGLTPGATFFHRFAVGAESRSAGV